MSGSTLIKQFIEELFSGPATIRMSSSVSNCRMEPGLFHELASLAVLMDEEQLIDRAPSITRFPETRPLARSEARRCYANGESLYIVGLDRVDEQLRGLCDELAQELAIESQYVSIEAWAAGGATAVHWHYDLDFNFNIQLRGKKEWRTAANLTEENPIRSFHANSSADAESDSAKQLMTLEDIQTWTANPGDVVYLPRGVWHATETAGATLSLAFVVRPPTWADLVAGTIRDRMHQQVKWRERVLGTKKLANQTELRDTALEAINASRQIFEELGPAELMFQSFWTGAPQLFRLPEAIREATVRSVEARLLLTWEAQSKNHEIELPSWAKGAIEHVLTKPGPHSIAKLHDHVSALDAPFLNAFVTRHVEIGFLERVAE